MPPRSVTTRWKYRNMTSTEFSLQISKFDHDIAIPDARRFGPLLLLKRALAVGGRHGA